ncbi:MAG: hypothetical protein KAU94_05955 [Verrucomicrobia bacterium]|nr:hypothetical protein [Verrucomicrobiota bacterium]
MYVHFLSLPSDPAVTSNALAIRIHFPSDGVLPPSFRRLGLPALPGKQKASHKGEAFKQKYQNFYLAFFAVHFSHACLSVHFVQADLSAFFAVHAEQAAFLLSAFFALHPQLSQASATEPATIRATIAILSTFLITHLLLLVNMYAVSDPVVFTTFNILTI